MEFGSWTWVRALRRWRNSTAADADVDPTFSTSRPALHLPRARASSATVSRPPQHQHQYQHQRQQHRHRPGATGSLRAMAEAELRELVQQLQAGLHSRAYGSAPAQLARAKQLLLRLDALLPTPTTPPARLALARDTLELGALVSIRLRDPPAFTRYVGQLQPLYAMPAELFGGGSGSGGGGGGGSPVHGNKAKITGLYLLLLLSQGDYAGFHTLLEALAAAHEEDGSDGVGAGERGNGAVEQDPFIQYPVRLERALMEGSYDRVWGETKSERVPSEEFGVFSEVLVGTIRSEIASCSERAYASLPVANAKNLFFLDSEGAVVHFARDRGWTVRDGRIYFPPKTAPYLGADDGDDDNGRRGTSSSPRFLDPSKQLIGNALSYARDLETIV